MNDVNIYILVDFTYTFPYWFFQSIHIYLILQISKVDVSNYQQDKWKIVAGINIKHVWGEYEKENKWFYTAIKQRLTLKRMSRIDRKLAVFPLLGNVDSIYIVRLYLKKLQYSYVIKKGCNRYFNHFSYILPNLGNILDISCRSQSPDFGISEFSGLYHIFVVPENETAIYRIPITNDRYVNIKKAKLYVMAVLIHKI